MADLHRLLDGSPTTDPASLSRSMHNPDHDYFSSPLTQPASLLPPPASVRVGSSLLDVSMGPAPAGSSLGVDWTLGPLDDQTVRDQSQTRDQLNEWQSELDSDRNPLASTSTVSCVGLRAEAEGVLCVCLTRVGIAVACLWCDI